MKFFTALAAFWKAHGTKILGTITAVLATLLTLDTDQMHALFGATAPRVALAVTGLLTVLRGLKNTQDIAQAVVDKDPSK